MIGRIEIGCVEIYYYEIVLSQIGIFNRFTWPKTMLIVI